MQILGNLRIALIGTGALGSALARRLAEARATDVLLIDPDRLQQRNLLICPFLRHALRGARTQSTQSGAREVPAAYSANTLRTPRSRFSEAHGTRKEAEPLFKADLLALHAQRQALPWQALTVEIADAGWQHLDACDVLCCCTDSALSRGETAYAAHMLGKPMIEGGVLGGTGTDDAPECRTAWFPANRTTACYLCGIREDRRAQMLAYAASATLGCAPLEDSPSMSGAPETVARAADGMLQLLLRFAKGKMPQTTSEAWRSRRLPSVTWHPQRIELPLSSTCPWHTDSFADLHSLPWNEPLRDSLSRPGFQDAVLQLAWPVCTAALCRICHAAAEPFRRVAYVRRSLRCGTCGNSACMEPVRSMDTVRNWDSLAARSPRQLGQPEAHLYALRRPMRFHAATFTGKDAEA